MPTNEFKIFDENKENVLSTESYSSDSERINGFSQGVARSIIVNKALYQSTLMAAALGQVLNNKGVDATEDIDELSSSLQTNIGNNTTVVQLTITNEDWDIDTREYTATIEGILEDESKQMICIAPLLSSADTCNNYGIVATAQAENSITFKCNVIPTATINIYVVFWLLV